MNSFLNTGIPQLSLDELNIAAEGKPQTTISENEKRDASGKRTITLPSGQKVAIAPTKPADD